MKQSGSETFFQLRNLSADRRLLNAVMHLARSRRHTAMANHMIEKLEVMNINFPSSLISMFFQRIID